DIHKRPENDSSVEKHTQYISDNLPSSEDKNEIAENSELFSRDDNCISESNMSGKESTEFLSKGTTEATRQISEIEIAKESGTCKVNENMPSIALSYISTESNEKFSNEVTSKVNFNQGENPNLKSSESYTTNKKPGYKRKRKTRYSSVYANNNHTDICPESFHEASKGDEKLEKERETYSDSDIEILEEFVVSKIKVEGRRISNLNLKSSEPFTTNKRSHRKRKRKICRSSVCAINNHSNIYPETLHETSKNDEKLEIEKECESYSDSDIEILEEFIVRKIKVESQKISGRRNGRYRQLDFISKSSTNKKFQKEGPKAIFSHKKQTLAENFDISVKENHLLEKIESKLHHIGRIIKDKRYSEIRKQKALILLKEMSPILEKAETFCNNFQMNSRNSNNFSNGTFLPFKLKQIQFLYSNLMKESSVKLRNQNSNEVCFSKYLVRSVGSEEQQKQSKFVSGGEVYERSNDTNFPSSSKNSNGLAKNLVSSRLVNCDAHSIKRKIRKINNEPIQTHVNDEFNLNLGNKHLRDVSFETLINKKKENFSTWKERRSENISLLTEKESEMADKENFTQNVIINCDSTVTLNDSVNFSNETQCFESLDTDFNIYTADKGSGREITMDLVGEQSDLVQKNSPVILKFNQGTDAPVASVPILEDNITNKEYCDQEVTTTVVNNHVNDNSSNRFDGESNMTVDEIQNSLDE
ncbi:hypothetical protein AVEN_131014-1, partial [Araneus ventricosus]